MAYSKTVWVQDSLPAINATNLNKIESGIEDVHNTASSHTTTLTDHEGRIALNESQIVNINNKNTSQDSSISSINTTLSSHNTSIGKNTSDIQENKDAIASLTTGETLKGSFTPVAGTEYPTGVTSDSWYINEVDSGGYLFTGGDLVGKTANNMDKIIKTGTSTWALIENNANAVVVNKTVGTLTNPVLSMPLVKDLSLAIGSGAATFERLGEATYIRNGVLKTALADEPRFEDNGLLYEGSSTNLFLYNTDLTNGAWPKSNATVTGTHADPSLGTSAFKLITDTSTAVHQVAQPITYASGTTYTLSVIAKAAGYNYATLGLPTSAFGSDVKLTVDLTSGAVATTAGVSAYTVNELIDGWFDISVTATATASGSYWSSFYVNDQLDTTNSFTGDGVGGVYLFLPQIEELSFPTSKIKTTTTAVTRANDKLYIDWNVPYWWQSLSIFVDFDLLGSTHTANRFLIHDSNGANGYINVNVSSSVSFSIAGGIQTIGGLRPANTLTRLGVASDGLTFDGYLDGVLTTQDTAVGTTLGLSTLMYLGSNSATLHFYGHFKNLRAWNVKLTAEEARLA